MFLMINLFPWQRHSGLIRFGVVYVSELKTVEWKEHFHAYLWPIWHRIYFWSI